jgi:aminopeptidase N
MSVYTGTLVRVWTPPDKILQADVALQAGKTILTYFEDLYKLPFPLPKQDLVAVPDFSVSIPCLPGFVCLCRSDFQR